MRSIFKVRYEIQLNMGDTYAGYNKGNTSGTLTGNWVEENALQKVTGSSRYAPFLGEDGKAVADQGTFQRVVQHDTKNDGNVYQAMSKTERPCLNEEHIVINNVGKRGTLKQQRLLARAKQIVLSEHEQKKQQAFDEQERFETTNQSMTKNINAAHPRNEHNEELNAYKNNGDYTTDTAVSIYTHAIAKGEGINFRGTSSLSSNPLAKSTAFTNDIRDGKKYHAEATERGIEQPNTLGMTHTQKSTMMQVKTAFQQASSTFYVESHIHAYKRRSTILVFPTSTFASQISTKSKSTRSCHS